MTVLETADRLLRIYGTPIAPLGQTYQNPPAEDLARFRSLWAAYGAGGLSW